MHVDDHNEASIQKQIEKIAQAMEKSLINVEKVMADNLRLRELMRVSENELRQRREHIYQLETRLKKMQEKRVVAQKNIDQAVTRLDQMLNNSSERDK
ncbi:MAG: hypothetical protein Q9M28_00535 [Mariprofundaceae bacterium]|nr:hypothetical protein [Mariprofundaceae bacterium]